MSTTDELRRLLDERGVKWWPMRNNGYYEDRDTEFVAHGKKHTAHEWGDSFAVYGLTPEQAIAATLGNGECTPHGEWESITQTQEVRRVFCDCGYELGMDERDSWPFKSTRLFAMPNYCQECGRKIRKAVKR